MVNLEDGWFYYLRIGDVPWTIGRCMKIRAGTEMGFQTMWGRMDAINPKLTVLGPVPAWSGPEPEVVRPGDTEPPEQPKRA